MRRSNDPSFSVNPFSCDTSWQVGKVRTKSPSLWFVAPRERATVTSRFKFLPMPRTRSLALCLLLTASAMLSAREIQFGKGGGVEDYFSTSRAQKNLVIEKGDDGKGVLTYRCEAGGAFFGVGPVGEDLESSAQETEVEFRVEGRITFGLFLRGKGPDEDSYMVFLAAIPDGQSSLFFCKTKFDGAQQPSKTALAHKVVKGLESGRWYKLRVKIGEGATVPISVELSEAEGSGPIAELTAVDGENPITGTGRVAIRLVANKTEGGGLFQIRSLSVSP